MMKHFISFTLCTAALLGGCQKEPLDSPAATHGELTFNTSLDGVSAAQSRAATVDSDLRTYGFYLAGYHTEGKIDADHATVYPNVFDKEVADLQIAVPLVKYESSKFTLKTIKWLLNDVSYLSFFGWSQSKPFATTVDASTTGILNQTFDSSNKGYPWIDIRNADAPLDQTDVVGSRSLNHKNDAVLSAVDLDFRHLLSKLTFKAKSSSGANITFTGVNIKYAANKVGKKARYTFGSDAVTIGTYGSFAEYHSATAPLNATYPAITNGAEIVLGSALLLPQELAAGDVSIELKYKLSPNSGNIEGAEQTKTLPLSAFTFEQGNNYTYTINVLSTSILIEPSPTIEPWDVVAMPMPLVLGPRGDVLLLLDGYDKPYIHTDGKHYWLDRSGYNRHCEIVGYTDGMYSSSEHLYNLTATQYLQVPALPLVTALSMDVVCQGTRDDDQVLFSFIHQGDNHINGGFRNFFAQFGFKNNQILYFDVQGTANTGRLTYQSSSAEIQKKLMWSFQKQDKGNIAIHANGIPKAKMTDTGTRTLGELVDNRIGSGYQGAISYVKITRGLSSIADVNTEYLAQNTRHKLDKPVNPYLPAVADGMVACWDARSGLENHSGDGNNSQWVDQTGEGLLMTAVVPQSVNASLTHNVSEKAITSVSPVWSSVGAGNDGVYMYCDKDLTTQSITFETISQSTGGLLNYFIEAVDKNNQDVFIARPNTGNGSKGVQITCKPYRQDHLYTEVEKIKASASSKRQLVFVVDRTNSKLIIYLNGEFIAEESWSTTPAQEMLAIDKIYLLNNKSGKQAYTGNIHAFRIYNRALSSDEIKTNYDKDKVTFGFP